MVEFELQPEAAELQSLAQEYWDAIGERSRELEKAAFEAGSAIRNGEFYLAHLEKIVRWKSDRVVHHLSANTNEEIERSLRKAVASESSPRDAMEALMQLHGVAVPVASAILTAIFPEHYTVLDFRALEALGQMQHDLNFYERYLAFCRRLAESGYVEPQINLPAQTTLRVIDRALWQWSNKQSKSIVI